MPHKMALTSSGPYSGKSTLARYLRDNHGFLIADHSRSLVSSYVDHMHKNYSVYAWLTVEDVYRNKEVYRRNLQEFGYIEGYNDPRGARKFIERTLERAGVTHDTDVVYDPFRGELQASVLRDLGFTLVQLEIPEDVRRSRAEALGHPYDQVVRSMDAHPELERGIEKPDIRLVATLPVQKIAEFLLGDAKIRRMIRG